MSRSHTPAPWNVFCAANAAFTRHPSIVSDAGEVAKATWAGSEQQTNANARLISAAPELLIALRDLLEDAVALGICESNLSGSAVAARAAIAKAKGETK